MASEYILSKATRLSSSSSYRSYSRAINARGVSSGRWTSTSTTRTTTRPLPHPNPFFARACNEKTTPLTLHRKRHEHVTCEETLAFANPAQQQQQKKKAQDLQVEQQNNSHQDSTTTTMGRSGYDTTNMHKGMPPRRPAASAKSVSTAKKGHGTNKSISQAELMAMQSKMAAQHLSQKQGPAIPVESQVWAPEWGPLPSLEGRGWTFWI